MKQTFRHLLSATAMAALVATSAAADEPKRGGTLTMALQQTPRHLNPAVQSGTATGQPGTQLFASLLRYDEGWEPQPYLAEAWEVSEDGLSVTIDLVDGAVFHDGTPITSEDVAFSIDTVKANHPFKSMFAPVESVETPDPNTAIIKLSQPHPALLLAMSSQLLSIIPKHIYGDGQDPKAHPANSENVVGSGPFKLVEFKRGEHVILERFDDYFIEGLPYLDRIVMRIMPDESTRTIALESGELTMSGFEQNPRNIVRLKKNDGLVVNGEGYAAIGPVNWLAFNTKADKVSDPKVRQAIAYAVDREFINKALNLGTAPDALTGIHPGSPFYDASVPSYDLDLDKANDLLDEAGYPAGSDGIRFGLTVDYGWPAMKAYAEYMKPQLKKIGIDVTVRSSADFPTWAKRISTWDFDMTMDNVFNWGDPVIGVHRTYSSDNIKEGVIWSNTQQYSNDRVDELMAMAGATNDPAKRKALYAEFQQILAEELPLYPIWASPYHTVSSTSVGNAPVSVWGTSTPLDRVYLK
ncbi:ABC transporter substrate-binding protein [Primorskyibacter sp. S187A]|uniref:ABC transporter substrate-binding protein n=1 Tax=Primorskyibacter sp. S187A TaxID=3415130 RepID=UPI003C7CFC7E